jgi:Fur family transcriptional regulator, ferric uptake regulator
MSSRANLDELRQEIRARGLRATPSRIAVLETLRAIEQPISHAEVAARLDQRGWDPATLYRNLMDFAEAGLVRRSDLGDHVWRFELKRGAHDTSAHPHFVCTACGTMECLPVIELVIPRGKAPRAVRQRRVEVHLRGLCDACG